MFDEKENFPGEKQIADMLSSLNRVDVPGDFDTRVRARIARGVNGEGTGAWTTNLVRVGVPVAAAIVIGLGGYFAFTLIDTGQKDVPSVAEVQPMVQTPIVAPPTPLATNDNQAEERMTAKPSDEMMADKINAEPPDGVARGEKDKMDANSNTGRPTGGSRDLAVRESQRVYPRGLNPDANAPTNAKGVDPNARIHVSSILDFIGVKATWASEGWRVESVAAGNIAESSGIKTGDVIEAINGQTVDKKTTFPATFDGKSLRVRRDGVSIQINFRP